MPSAKKTEEKKSGGIMNWLNKLNSPETDTSASGLMGSITLLVGLVIFIILAVFYMIKTSEAVNILALIDKDVVIISIGSALLGIRKFSGVLRSNKYHIEGSDLKSIADMIHNGGKDVDDDRHRGAYEEENEGEAFVNDIEHGEAGETLLGTKSKRKRR